MYPVLQSSNNIALFDMFEQMDEAAYCNIPQYFLLVGFCAPVHCAHLFFRLYFLSVFIKRNISLKFLHASLKTFSNSVYCSKRRIRISSSFSSLPLVDFSLCFSAIGFSHFVYHIHSSLPKQCSGTQAAFCMRSYGHY
jgi:hypothetical protein